MAINLVVNQKMIREKAEQGDFFQSDFSMGWVNTISRQMGSCPVFDVEDDPGLIFNDVPVVIVSSSVGPPSGDLGEKARDFVGRGGVLVLEMPDSGWVRAFNQKIRDSSLKVELVRAAKGFETFNFRILPDPYPDVLSMMPVCTRTFLTDSPPDVMEVLMRLSGSPAILQYRFQEGWVIVLLFDAAMQLSCLRQGVPGAGDYTVRELRGKVPLVKEPDDLALDNSMLNNLHPFADILENFLFAALEDLTFLPRLWYYPYSYDGVFLMTHDDEKKGLEKSRYLFDVEAGRGFVSTFFIISSGEVLERWPSVKEFTDGNFDVQWHWDRFPDPFGKNPPQAQLNGCRSIPGADPGACRIHFLNWGNDYLRPFDQMEELGITLDSTLGPNKGRGYVFGTGWPFHPLNRQGELYNLQEIPFVSQEDWYGADKKFFDKLIEASRSEYHSVICCIFHPEKGTEREGSLRDLWLGSLEKARSENHWITTFRDLERFLKKRSRVKVVSTSGDPDGATLENGFEGVCMKLPVYNIDKTGATGELDPAKVTGGNFRVVMETGRKYRLVPYES